MEPVPLLIVNGAIGSGKSTVLGELSEILRERKVPFTAVDLDALTQTWPAPDDDRFNIGLGCRNLTTLWENGRRAGSTHLVVASVVESRSDFSQIVAAVAGAVPYLCRLAAPDEELRRRVEGRELGSGRRWHLERAVHLAKILEAAAIDDEVVETGGRVVRDVALEVLLAAGWSSGGG